MKDKENKLILYKDDEGKVSVNVRFADEDVWLTQEQLSVIYDTTQQNISQHVINIYNDKELESQYNSYTTTIADWEQKVSDIEDSYYKKFAAMESALAELQSQSSQLSGLLG